MSEQPDSSESRKRRPPSYYSNYRRKRALKEEEIHLREERNRRQKEKEARMSICKAQMKDLLKMLKSSDELSTSVPLQSERNSASQPKCEDNSPLPFLGNDETPDLLSTSVLSASTSTDGFPDSTLIHDNESRTLSPPPSPSSSSSYEFEAVPSSSKTDFPPASPSSCIEDENIDIIEQQLMEIKRLFGGSSSSLREQRKYIDMLRKIKPSTQKRLKKDPRSLRPPSLKAKITRMGPGKMAYFGIEYILNKAPSDLFTSKNAEVRLTANIDGVPVFKSKLFNLWPILACIEEKPVFVVGLYAGKNKPPCSNTFLKPFVEEVIHLRNNGLRVKHELYKFILHKLIMDAPAKAYVLGVKSHKANAPCTRCHVVGVKVDREGLATKASQFKRAKKGRAFLNFKAPLRTMSEYMDANLPECDPEVACEHPKFWNSDDEQVASDSDYYSSSDDDPPQEVNAEQPQEINDADKESPFYRHRTILTQIPGFDIVRDIPHEYLHLVCLGLMKKLLGIFKWLLKQDREEKVVEKKGSTRTGKRKKRVLPKCVERFKNKQIIGKNKRTVNKPTRSQTKNSIKMTKEKMKKNTLTESEKKVDQRIIRADTYRPREFQRGPETLDELSHYKGTQFRGMVLYYGPYIFDNIIERPYTDNFFLLSVAIRALVCNVLPHDKEQESHYMKNVAKHVDILIQQFVNDGIDLYGPEFVVYNLHCLTHAAQDFLRFGPIDRYSAFRFESFLGRLKKYIKTGCQPLTQMINVYSTRLQYGMFNAQSTEPMDGALEYMEEPELRNPLDIEEIDGDMYETFQEIRFKYFVLHSKNKRDKHCVIRTKTGKKVAYVMKILRNCDTQEEYLMVRSYKKERNLFTKPISAEAAGLHTCSHLSKRFYLCPVSSLLTKCYAFPLTDDVHGEWAAAEYLH